MRDGLESISEMEYPGRLIILGRDKENEPVIVYGLSGRSDSSQARRLRQDEETDAVYIEVTDEKVLEQGDPALLVYDAITHEEEPNLTIVSNGAQTRLLRDIAVSYGVNNSHISPEQLLSRAFRREHFMRTKDGRIIDLTKYEPDEPNYTPRVSGVFGEEGAVLSIAKKRGKGVQRNFYEVPLRRKEGTMIATYDGPNEEPLPSFEGEPRMVEFNMHNREIAEAVYEAVGEFAVSVACFIPEYGMVEIKNRHEEGE